MQTFLPLPCFSCSARVLDRARLGKQRVEAQQLLNALTRREGGWTHHPAALMWEGYEPALELYRDTMIIEWVRRGYANTMLMRAQVIGKVELPQWFGNAAFHDSHKSNLLFKNPRHYREFGWDVSWFLEYVWPVSDRAF